MNNHLIKKIITSNNLPCPDFIFENPLLDKRVAEVLAKSFVKILNISEQNSSVNNNMRLSILEIIRKMCQIEPENHLKVDDNISTLLVEVYEQRIKEMFSNVTDNTNKDLDAYLIRNMKDLNINSSYESTLNPEIIQALNNLDTNSVHINNLFKDLIHWRTTDNKLFYILKDYWTAENPMSEDIFIQLKSELERILLEICNNILSNPNLNIEELFITNSCLKNIVIKSSNYRGCFQICCNILHYLFVMTNYNIRIQMFVQAFVANVKNECSYLSFSVLYPDHVSNIVILLDMEIDQLPIPVQNTYIDMAVRYLSELQKESESDLIMMLSHFPHWFHIYFHKKNSM